MFAQNVVHNPLHDFLLIFVTAAAFGDLCRSVGRNRMVGFLPRQLISQYYKAARSFLVCSLSAAACVDLCRSVGHNRRVGFLPRQLTSHP